MTHPLSDDELKAMLDDRDATIARLERELGEARDQAQKAETALLLSDEGLQHVSVSLGGPDEWADQEAMLWSVRRTVERTASALGEAREVLSDACDQMLASYQTWVADDSEAHPKPGQIPRYDRACAVLVKLNGASS